MKLKLKSVVTRVLASAQSSAIAAIAATAIAMTPVAAKAQTASVTDVFPILSGVELTTQQKIQLIELASNLQSQIGQIVTSDQQNRFRTALGQGQGFAEAIARTQLLKLSLIISREHRSAEKLLETTLRKIQLLTQILLKDIEIKTI